MKHNIVNCISLIDYFNREEFDSLGLGVEIQDFTEPGLLDKGWEERVKQYKELLYGFSNTISIHGPFLDLSPISPDKTIREASYNRYLTTLKISQQLNADYIVFHSQINPFLNKPILKELNNNLNRKFWREILEEVGGFQGTILIENIFENDPILIKHLIETIDLPNFKICLDIGHAKLMMDKGLEDCIKELKDKIEYIHLHWNDGLYDDHNRPSDENIIFIMKLLEKYSLNPTIALEYNIDNKDLKEEVNRF